MTDIAETQKQAEFLTEAFRAFREVQSGPAWSSAASKYRHSKTYYALPDHMQEEIAAAAEAARVRVNKLAGA